MHRWLATPQSASAHEPLCRRTEARREPACAQATLKGKIQQGNLLAENSLQLWGAICAAIFPGAAKRDRRPGVGILGESCDLPTSACPNEYRDIQ